MVPDHRDLIRAAQLDRKATEKMARGFYTAKARVYRDTLAELSHRHGHPRARVVLSSEIRDALQAEATDHAEKVTATFNRMLNEWAVANRDLPRQLFAGRLQMWQRERAKNRGPMISQVEVSTPRLDALVSFYRENGVEPDFELVGPPAKCPLCKELKRTGPHPLARVLEVGYPHIGCSHRWRAKTRASAVLRAGGERPGTISAGRGGPAGIVGGEAFVSQHGGQEAAAAAIRAMLA